jgi:chaperonin GroEL
LGDCIKDEAFPAADDRRGRTDAAKQRFQRRDVGFLNDAHFFGLASSSQLDRTPRRLSHDQKTGIDIVWKALSTPARQIAINAGEDGSIVVGKISENDTYAFGYDAQEGEYGDLVSKGIIDPTKVVRTALQDAASIAGLLMTTEAMVAEKPKKETPMPAMPPGGGMDY